MTTRAAAMVDLDRLTPREEQCLRDVADGLTSKQIGRRRTMSPRTADTRAFQSARSAGSANPSRIIEALRLIAVTTSFSPAPPAAIAVTSA